MEGAGDHRPDPAVDLSDDGIEMDDENRPVEVRNSEKLSRAHYGQKSSNK